MKMKKNVKQLRPDQDKSVNDVVRWVTQGYSGIVSKPTGSGKGTEIGLLVNRLTSQETEFRRICLVIAPQNNNLANIIDSGNWRGGYGHMFNGPSEGSYKILSSNNNTAVIAGVSKFLNDGYVLGGENILCVTHNAAVRVVNDSDDSLPEDLTGAVLIIDECHYFGTKLQKLVKLWRERGGVTVGYTATAWRSSDNVKLIQEGDKFFYLSLSEYQTLRDRDGQPYCPTELDMSVAVYNAADVSDRNFKGEDLNRKEANSAAKKAVATWKKQGKPKLVVYYVSTRADNNALIRNALLEAFRAECGHERVIDAAGNDSTDFDTALLTERVRLNAGLPSEIDVIIGNQRVHTAMNWPVCSAVYSIGMNQSSVRNSQLLGRSMRPKTEASGQYQYKSVYTIFIPGNGKDEKKYMQTHSENVLKLVLVNYDYQYGQRSLPLKKLSVFVIKKTPKERQEALREKVDEILAEADNPENEEYQDCLLQYYRYNQDGDKQETILRKLDEQFPRKVVAAVALKIHVEEGLIDFDTKKGQQKISRIINRSAKKATIRQAAVAVDEELSELVRALIEPFKETTLKVFPERLEKQVHLVTKSKELVGSLLRSAPEVRTFARLDQEIKVFHAETGTYPSSKGWGLEWQRWNNWLRRNNSSLAKYIKDKFGFEHRDNARNIERLKASITEYHLSYGEYPSIETSPEWAAWNGWLQYNHQTSLSMYIKDTFGFSYFKTDKGFAELDRMLERFNSETGTWPVTKGDWVKWHQWLMRYHNTTLQRYITEKFGFNRRPDRSLTDLDDLIKSHYQKTGKWPSEKAESLRGWCSWIKNTHGISIGRYVQNNFSQKVERTLAGLDGFIRDYKTATGEWPTTGDEEGRKWNNWLRNHNTSLRAYIKSNHGFDGYVRRDRSFKELDSLIISHRKEYGKWPSMETSRDWGGWDHWLQYNHGTSLSKYRRSKFGNSGAIRIDRTLDELNNELLAYRKLYNDWPSMKTKNWINWGHWLRYNHKTTLYRYIQDNFE